MEQAQAVFVVAAAVIVIVGIAAAAPSAAAIVSFLASLRGGLEEMAGVPSSRRVVAGGGVDLLFRGGVDSVPRESVVADALQFLLEQELEVFPSVSGSSSLEMTPKSNSSASQCRGASASYAAVGFHSGVGSWLSGMESMEEAEREEEEGEEEEEESPKELELEEEGIAMATG